MAGPPLKAVGVVKVVRPSGRTKVPKAMPSPTKALAMPKLVTTLPSTLPLVTGLAISVALVTSAVAAAEVVAASKLHLSHNHSFP